MDSGVNSFRHESRRMGGRNPHEAHRVATPLELLFDLTFATSFSLAASQGRPQVLHTSDHKGKRYEMTGPEALSMTEIAEQMSLAIGKIVRYVNISPADRSRALLAAGLPQYVVDALDVQAGERRKEATGEAVVHPETHAALGLRPTTFAEFARRNASVLRGEASGSRGREEGYKTSVLR
jgi:hypothetical protein